MVIKNMFQYNMKKLTKLSEDEEWMRNRQDIETDPEDEQWNDTVISLCIGYIILVSKLKR